MVKQIGTKEDFDALLKEAAKDDKAVFVDFTATWCGPCKMMGPKFEKLATEYTSIVFVKVDVDENEETAAHCGISAMPTFQVFKNEEKIDEVVGANIDKLTELCKKYK